MKSRQILQGKGKLKPRCLFPEEPVHSKDNLIPAPELRTTVPEYYLRLPHKKLPPKRLAKQRAIMRLQQFYWKKK